MRNIFEGIFGCRKKAIIEKLNASLEQANEKIKEIEAANAELRSMNKKLSLPVKNLENERVRLAYDVKEATDGQNRVWEKLEMLRWEYKDLEKKLQKRGADGRFIKKEK